MDTSQRKQQRHLVPIASYIPNLMGYTRIALAFWGLYESQQQNHHHHHHHSGHATRATYIWVASASLDLFDGMMARKLNQCSQLGVLLDIAADNILRTCFWMAAAVSTSSAKENASSVWLLMIATLIVSLEWITMICTQLHASSNSDHWKTCRSSDPWLIQRIFANNFRTPLGVLCIGGLFGSGFMAYAQTQPELVAMIPFFFVLRNLAFVGRAITMMAELWLCRDYLSLVIANDESIRSVRT